MNSRSVQVDEQHGTRLMRQPPPVTPDTSPTPAIRANSPLTQLFSVAGRLSVAPLLVFGAAMAMASDPPESSRVTLEQDAGQWSLHVDGQTFIVKGAGMGYSTSSGIASLAQAGGNAFRTWGTEHLDVQLDAALMHGLKVLAGLDMQTQLQGFDYEDATAVRRQQTRLEASIEKYRDHPALLGWIIANEPNLMVDGDGRVIQANSRVYQAMADVLRFVHENDPNHPATVALAFTPTLEQDVRHLLDAMPAIDFLSFQGYGALPAIGPAVQAMAIDKPYMITEFGPLGHWEMPATRWGREIEETSAAKANGLAQRMRSAGLDSPEGQLLGGFAFLWGYKQERTPTWYGLFTEEGERTASVDELTRLWTGRYPVQRAPLATSLTLDGQAATASVTLAPGQSVHADLQVNDPDNDSLSIRWSVMREVDERSHGGHFEARPAELDVQFTPATDGTWQFRAPTEPGEYRLYGWASDGHGGVATANIPFLVDSP